jgi:hypothetical protein
MTPAQLQNLCGCLLTGMEANYTFAQAQQIETDFLAGRMVPGNVIALAVHCRNSAG